MPLDPKKEIPAFTASVVQDMASVRLKKEIYNPQFGTDTGQTSDKNTGAKWAATTRRREIPKLFVPVVHERQQSWKQSWSLRLHDALNGDS